MADPITIASVGSLVISEGVKFLYNQATEFLKRIQAEDGIKALHQYLVTNQKVSRSKFQIPYLNQSQIISLK